MLNQPTKLTLTSVFQILECIELNMIEENVATFGFNKETPKPLLMPSTQLACGQSIKASPQRLRGLNMDLEVVLHHILQNRGQRTNVGDVVGFITRGIVLIPFGVPFTIPTPTSLVLITRFMVMTWTITLHCTLGFNRLNSQVSIAIKPQDSSKVHKGKGASKDGSTTKLAPN